MPLISFSYSGKQGGAVLSLPVKARREDTLIKSCFGTWIVKHIDHWFAFARRSGFIEQMEEIILVTGCDHTRSWTNVAFFGNEPNARATFGVRVVHSPAISIEWQYLPEHGQGAILHRGPEGPVRWFTISQYQRTPDNFGIALCLLLEPTRRSVCVYPRISCRSPYFRFIEASKSGRRLFFRPRW